MKLTLMVVCTLILLTPVLARAQGTPLERLAPAIASSGGTIVTGAPGDSVVILFHGVSNWVSWECFAQPCTVRAYNDTHLLESFNTTPRHMTASFEYADTTRFREGPYATWWNQHPKISQEWIPTPADQGFGYPERWTGLVVKWGGAGGRFHYRAGVNP